MARLATRLWRLEARRPPVAEPPYRPPEPSPGWVEEVLCLLWQYGGFGSVEEMVHDALGVTDTTRAMEVARLLQETADALPT